MNNVREFSHAHSPLTSGIWAILPQTRLGLSKDAQKATNRGNRLMERLRIKARKEAANDRFTTRKRMPKSFTYIERVEQVNTGEKQAKERKTPKKRASLDGLVFRAIPRETFDSLIRK